MATKEEDQKRAMVKLIQRQMVNDREIEAIKGQLTIQEKKINILFKDLDLCMTELKKHTGTFEAHTEPIITPPFK